MLMAMGGSECHPKGLDAKRLTVSFGLTPRLATFAVGKLGLTSVKKIHFRELSHISSAQRARRARGRFFSLGACRRRPPMSLEGAGKGAMGRAVACLRSARRSSAFAVGAPP